MAPNYIFGSMTAADLPPIRRWLTLPHVLEWWSDPREQYDLVSGDLDEPAMDQYIFSAAGDPLGYLQCYDLAKWNTGFGPQPFGDAGHRFVHWRARHDRTRTWPDSHSPLCRQPAAERSSARRGRSRSSQ